MRAGFADVVLDSQRAFRALLDAMAHPGRVVTMPEIEPPPRLDAATAATCLALLDHDTPVWLDPAAASGEVLAWLRFHTGAPVVEEPGPARFAVSVDPARLPALDVFDAGTDERPDLSATLIVQVDELVARDGFRLRGPGIEREARLHVIGGPIDLAQTCRANGSRFPRGVDFVLCAGSRLAALPRTTRVED